MLARWGEDRRPAARPGPNTLRPMEPSPPDYSGACVSRLVPALLGAIEWPWLPEPVHGARAVVLLVLDGLGADALDQHGAQLPQLTGLSRASISTVAPSTTAAALTSITTGAAPSQHGLVGYRARVDGQILNFLRWQWDGRSRPPDPARVQRIEPFLHHEIPVVTEARFRGSGFTDAHLRGARFVGYRTRAAMIEHIRRLVAAGDRFVYSYDDGIDAVAHEFGLADGFYTGELRSADDLVGAILDAVPDDVALVVASDHGQVDIPPDEWRELGGLSALVDAQAGDARFRYLFAARGAAAELAAEARHQFGDVAWVLDRTELIDAGWVGPPPERNLGGRFGDVVLAAREPVAFVDPALPRERTLRSMHGSVTAAEMTIPLLAGRGRGG